MKRVILAACLAVGAVQASEAVVVKTTETVATVTLSDKEQAFAAKLSPAQNKAFFAMTADQRQAVLAAAENPAVSANDAVEKVLKEHHVATTVKVEKN